MMQMVWQGEVRRPLRLSRACSCGCDTRAGVTGVGYLSGSDAAGNGVTIWIADEAVYRQLEQLLQGAT